MSLNEAPQNVRLKILGINSDLVSKVKLFSLGIHVNDSVIKLNKAKWGPVLFKNISFNSSKMALGKIWAKNIIVGIEE
jgi:Fe2+ transport system protein FeoA